MERSLKNVFTGLTPRERRLLAVMGALFFVFVVFIIVFLFKSSVSDLNDESEKLAASLQLIDEKGDDFKAEKQSRKTTAVSVDKPTPIRTLVEKVSKKLEVETPDMKELPNVRHGEKWVEKAMELTIREIDILKLTELMEEIESNRARFPIAISKLDINKRVRPTGTSYTATMTVSTYEQSEEAPEKDKTAKTRKKKTAQALKGGV